MPPSLTCYTPHCTTHLYPQPYKLNPIFMGRFRMVVCIGKGPLLLHHGVVAFPVEHSIGTQLFCTLRCPSCIPALEECKHTAPWHR